MRIARLLGPDAETRRHAFKRAKRSYDARSKVVHGSEHAVKNLEKTLDDTRELAREVLRRWVLDPPQGGVTALDEQMLA